MSDRDNGKENGNYYNGLFNYGRTNQANRHGSGTFLRRVPFLLVTEHAGLSSLSRSSCSYKEYDDTSFGMCSGLGLQPETSAREIVYSLKTSKLESPNASAFCFRREANFFVIVAEAPCNIVLHSLPGWPLERFLFFLIGLNSGPYIRTSFKGCWCQPDLERLRISATPDA